MVALSRPLLFAGALAQREFYQAGFMAPNYQYAAAAPEVVYQQYAPAEQVMYAQPEVQYAYPEAYQVYEQDAGSSWSDVALLAVAGVALGAAIGYKAQPQVSMLAVSGSSRRDFMDKAKNMFFGGLVAAAAGPAIANAADVKLGSDGGQLVFVPDEVTIKAGDSVTWLGNKGMPHNVVFDEEGVPSGVDAEAISMDDQLGDEGATYSKKFDVAGKYDYFCEPHRGAGMNAVLIVE